MCCINIIYYVYTMRARAFGGSIYPQTKRFMFLAYRMLHISFDANHISPFECIWNMFDKNWALLRQRAFEHSSMSNRMPPHEIVVAPTNRATFKAVRCFIQMHAQKLSKYCIQAFYHNHLNQKNIFMVLLVAGMI